MAHQWLTCVVVCTFFTLVLRGLASSMPRSDRYCSGSRYYILRDPWRSVQVEERHPPRRCDSAEGFAKARWYRFAGEAGAAMPTEPPPSDHRCGSDAPVWLNGSNPRYEDGVVRRKACARFAGDVCAWEWTIRVKRCPEGFLIYKLTPVKACRLTYCGLGIQNVTVDDVAKPVANEDEDGSGALDKQKEVQAKGNDGSPHKTTPPPTATTAPIYDGFLTDNGDDIGSGESDVKVHRACEDYHVLDEPQRSVHNQVDSNTGGSVLLCDKRSQVMNGQWYRFSGEGGNKMPTERPLSDHRCGTHAPVWMKGRHPTVKEGAVPRTVCAFWRGNECNWSWEIDVMACPGGYFVYKLHKPEACLLAYCTTDGAPLTTVPPPTPSISDETLSQNEDEVGSGVEEREVSYLVTYKGWRYFKVPVIGKMTSANVKTACEAAGYVTPCPGDRGCRFSSSSCVLTGLLDCDHPMREVSHELCGSTPSASRCSQLHGVYQFMHNWTKGGACGAESGSWCAYGSYVRRDRYALCATAAGAPPTTVPPPTPSIPDELLSDDEDEVGSGEPSVIDDVGSGELYTPGREASYLAHYRGWHYYKVPVTGVMTSANVKAACEAAGYVTPCPGDRECRFSSSSCVLTGLLDCDHPMREVSHELCGSTDPGAKRCSQLHGVYQFMHNWTKGGACGAEFGSWCAYGSYVRQDRYAFCATAAGAPPTTVPPPTPSVSDELLSDDEDEVGSGEPSVIDEVGSGEPYIPGREASYLAHYRGWHYYKVPVTGKMTSANVKAACEAAGYVTPCPGDSDCPHSTSSCVVTGLWDCNYPMNEVSNLLCGTDPNDCAELHGVYQFRNYGSACGAESGLSWCVSGSGKRGRYAFCATDQNTTSDAPRDATVALQDTTAAPHVTTAAPNKDHGNCCGNILRQATEVVDQSSGYRVPDGWTMCYIDERDTAYHDTPCKNLLKGIPGYKNARQLLAAGGNFGCWHGHSGDSPGPAYAANNVIYQSCRDGIQQETQLSAWNVRRTTLGVCIKSTLCVGAPETTAPPPTPSVSDELPSDDEDDVGSGQTHVIDDVGSGEPYIPEREVSYLATYKDWHYFKVPVTGEMTSANVKAACEAAGFVTPCPGDSGCRFCSSSCVLTGLKDRNPMNEVSKEMCGVSPNGCPLLHGVYQFMSNWGRGACGVESTEWCAYGYRNRYAFCATEQNVTTATPHDATTAPDDTTAAPNKEPRNCCGNILRQATELVDQSSGYGVPDGWTMCYIDERDTAYHDTPCKKLLKSIPGYRNARQLLAAGGNFGCWHGHSGDSPGPAFARNNVIEKSCQDGVQQTTRLSAWNVRRTTLGVCIKGIMCDGAPQTTVPPPQTTVPPPTPSISDELPSDDEDDVGSGESNNKGKNLALGKSTEQSSLWDAGYSSNAVDGDRSTNWYGASCTHTAASLRDDVWDVGTTEPWWYVDLGSSHPIGKVVIVNRRAQKTSVTARISPFELHVGNSKDVGANPTCGRRHVFPAEEDEMAVSCGGIHGRYVGIRLPGENRILTLCEVEVYAEPFPSDDEDDDVGSGVPDESVDRLPCAQHHVVDDLWRSVSNTNESHTCDDDSTIKNGKWHRFMRGRRSMMIPTERPLSRRRCGTHAPVWMKGRHPTVEEGVVTRTACAFWGNDECHWSWEIDVMACPGDYYVYKLQKPTHCNLAYCTTYASLQTTVSPVTTVPVPTVPYPSDDEDHDVGSGEADDSDVTPRTRISSLRTIPTPTEAPPSEDEDNADPKELLGSAYTYVTPLACEKHYVLDEPWRSVKTHRDKDYKCDQRTRLQHRHWYRFVGAGGDMMPTKRPPATNRCGTHAPVWMTGAHPNVEEGAVKRRVCAFWEEDECHWSWEIYVMACPGGYYVYRLPKPKICESAYCTTDSFGVDAEGSGEPEGSGPREPYDEDDIIFEGSEEEPLPSQESINVCPKNNVVTLPSGKEYVAGDGTRTYEDAQKECRRRGGIVAIPRSEEEQRELVFLKNCVSSDNQFWLGVRWKSEGWMDGRGTPLGGFTTWAPGEPDDRYNGYRCAHVVYGSKEGDRRNNWAETYCNSLYNYVCEIEEGVVPNAKAASCSDVKSLYPAGKDGEYTLYPFPTCKDVSIRVYCHNMASEQPEEFLTLPSGPGTNFANIYADRLRDNYGGRCDGPLQDQYSRRAGTTKFSKIRIKFGDSKVKVVRDDYTFANTEGHNNVSYGEAGDCYSWKQGCAKGTFVLDLTGTGLSLAPDVHWIMEERYPEYISINDLFISEDRTVASARCGGWCGHCWPAGKNLLLSHPQCDSSSQNSKAKGEDMKDIYRGCYKDGKRRRLPHALLISADMTADLCVKHCREKGHSYAGTQYHKECWCGDELPRRGPREDDECATPCGGNQKEMCGGGWRLSVYKVESIVDAAVPPEGHECQASDGASYRGPVAVTSSGRTCQRWDRQTPHEHTRTSANYPSSGLEENFCRNPDSTSGVWCYTTDPNKRWELCDVPVCGSIPENPATPPPVSTEVAATTASLRENPATQVPVHKAINATSTVCPVSGYVRVNGACYKGFAELKTYDDARQRCAADGGLLAMPKDRATNRFINNLHRASSWLGLTDANSEGRWVFEDGRTLKSSGFANWGRREPNNADGNEDCAEVLSTRSLWNDVPCNSTKEFTCQIGQGVTYVTTDIPPTPTPASRLNPKVTTEERVTVLKHTNVTLRCTVRMRRTNIHHRINWYRVGENGTQGAPLMTYIDRNAFHNFRRTAALGLDGRLEAVDDHASLRILRVKGEDSGTYRCEVILASQQRSYADVNMTVLECPTDKKDQTVISKAVPTEVARSEDQHNHPGQGIVVISDSESAFTVALVTGAIFSILFVIIVAVVLLAWRKWGK